MEELLLDDATALYAEKEASIGAETLRDIERRVMLSVIDQHWREHLYEMDYLQEGINLRVAALLVAPEGQLPGRRLEWRDRDRPRVVEVDEERPMNERKNRKKNIASPMPSEGLRRM